MLALDVMYISWQFNISNCSYMLPPAEAATRCIASLPYFAFASLTALRTRSELLRFVSVDDLLPGTLTRMLGACSRKQPANMQGVRAAELSIWLQLPSVYTGRTHVHTYADWQQTSPAYTRPDIRRVAH